MAKTHDKASINFEEYRECPGVRPLEKSSKVQIQIGTNTVDECYLLQEDFEEISFAVPLIDELTSSDDSDLETSVYYDESYTLRSLASAIQIEFLQKLPGAKPADHIRRSRKYGNSDYKALNSYVSLSKSWSEESDLDAEKSTEDFTKSMKKYEHSCSATATAIVPHRKQYNKQSEMEDSCTTQILRCKANFASNVCHSSRVLTIKHSSISPQIDLPRNALILYLGCIKMTPHELRHFDLTRCIQTLFSRRRCEFALLKIKIDQFVIEYCSRKERNASEREGRSKRKRKKSSVERGERARRQTHVKHFSQDYCCSEERRAQKKRFLSCIGFPGTSKYQHLLQHKDSINLKSYEVLRRKKSVFEFQFPRIIFCGAEITNMPTNMLVWVYHVVSGNCSSVECHAIECDDQQHARLLSRALSNEIVKSNNMN